MSRIVQPPKSVLLLVGREDFTPPTTFRGGACVATGDCLAVAVSDGPVAVTLGPAGDTGDLTRLAEFVLESEGHLSLRDVYSREYETVGVEPGLSTVTVWANDGHEPSELVLTVHGL